MRPAGRTLPLSGRRAAARASLPGTQQPLAQLGLLLRAGVPAGDVGKLLQRAQAEELQELRAGAVLYRTGTRFLKLFGLRTLQELPDIARWDPSPQEHAELRERLLRAGEARAGNGAPPS